MTTADSTQNPASEPEPSTVPGRAAWVLAEFAAEDAEAGGAAPAGTKA